MSQAAEFLQFITPHNTKANKLSGREIGGAAVRFCTLVDGMLLAYPAKARQSAPRQSPRSMWLSLHVPFTDGTKVRFSIFRERAGWPVVGYSRQIAVLAINPDGRRGEGHVYKYGPGTVEVARSDTMSTPTITITDPEDKAGAAERWQQQDPVVILNDDEAIATAEAKLTAWLEQERLERQMGYNHLPVGIAEINMLRSRVYTAVVD